MTLPWCQWSRRPIISGSLLRVVTADIAPGCRLGTYVRARLNESLLRTRMLSGVSLGHVAEQAALVIRLSMALAARLRSQSRVGAFMSNRPQYALLQLASERAGIVRVPMN